jgi:cytochrome c oxidase assembly protein subunit 15
MNELKPWAENLLNNPIMIHFMHRGLGYLLLAFVILFFIESRKIVHVPLFTRFANILIALFIAQVALGIFTVLNATDKRALVWLGVSHQFFAMIIVVFITALLFLIKRPKVTLG